MNTEKPLILIVDDNPMNIDLLLDVLKADYTFSVAKSGQKALDFLKRNVPDIILLDIMMPEMDGFEVCTRLKADSWLKEIPVIFITALTEAKYIVKGFDIDKYLFVNPSYTRPITLLIFSFVFN